LPSLAPVRTAVSPPKAVAPVEAAADNLASLSTPANRSALRVPLDTRHDLASAAGKTPLAQAVSSPRALSGRPSSAMDEAKVEVATQDASTEEKAATPPSAHIVQEEASESEEISSEESPLEASSARPPAISGTFQQTSESSSPRSTPERRSANRREAASAAAGAQSVDGATSLAQPSVSAPSNQESDAPSAIRLQPVENAGQVVSQLTQVSPTQLPAAYTAGREAFSSALQAQRYNLQAQLPVIAAPTGMPGRRNAPDTAAEAVPETAAPTRLLASVPVSSADGQDYETRVAEPPPLRQPSTQIEGDDNAGAGDAAVSESAQSALTEVRFSTNSVPLDAGPSPSLDLSGEADPGQLSQVGAVAAGSVVDGVLTARQNTTQDFGEGAIAPEESDAQLQASTALSAPEQVAVPAVEPIHVSPDFAGQLDASLAPSIQARMTPLQAEVDQGDTQFQVGLSDQRAAADAEIAGANENTRREQLAIRGEAQAEVTAHQSEWRDEIESVETKYREGAQTESETCHQEISKEQVSAEAKASEELSKAEIKVSQETVAAEAKATEEKRKAEEKSGGFFGWAKQAARALIDGLKAVVNTIYDGLRALVKGVFELAKKVVSGILELARQVVVGLIKAYGEVLKALVSVALAAFPELAERFRKQIDAAVDFAVQAVNVAAKLLTQIVTTILDGLAQAIDGLLGLVQSIYSGMLTLIGMLVSGELQAIFAGLRNLYEAASEMPNHFEAAALECVVGGSLLEPLSSQAELEMAEQLGFVKSSEDLEPADADPDTTRHEGGDSDHEMTSDRSSVPKPPWTEENVEVDPVPDDADLSPDVEDELDDQFSDGGNSVEVAANDDSDHGLGDIEQELQASKNDPSATPDVAASAATEPPVPDGLTPLQRGQVKWELMKERVAQWWKENKVAVITLAVGAIAGVAVAAVLTGGGIFALVPPLLAALQPLFLAIAISTFAQPLRDYIQHGWAGDKKLAAMDLAKGLAALLVELIGLLTAKAGSAILRGARGISSSAARSGRALINRATKVGRGITRGARQAGGFAIRRGKLVLRGVGRTFARGYRRLSDLGKGLVAQLRRFGRFWFEIDGTWLSLFAQVNPPKLILRKKLVYGKTSHILLKKAANGSYTVTFESGLKYHGKGGTARARKSARRMSRKHRDRVMSIQHSPASSNKRAFQDEARRLAKDGGPGGNNYNQIESPGLRMLED